MDSLYPESIYRESISAASNRTAVRSTVTAMRLRTVLATVTAGLAAATCLSAAGPANAASGNACSRAVSIDGYRISSAVHRRSRRW